MLSDIVKMGFSRLRGNPITATTSAAHTVTYLDRRNRPTLLFVPKCHKTKSSRRTPDLARSHLEHHQLYIDLMSLTSLWLCLSRWFSLSLRLCLSLWLSLARWLRSSLPPHDGQEYVAFGDRAAPCTAQGHCCIAGLCTVSLVYWSQNLPPQLMSGRHTQQQVTQVTSVAQSMIQALLV